MKTTATSLQLPTHSKDSNEDSGGGEVALSYQLETEKHQKQLFQRAIQRLEGELVKAREENNVLQRQHDDALAMTETEHQQRLRELESQIDTLNKRWLAVNRKSQQLEKTMEEQKLLLLLQQQQIQNDGENNAKRTKELQDTKAYQYKMIKTQRAETVNLSNNFQKTIEEKEVECQRLNQQLIEVRNRLEEKVKVSVTEKKRRDMVETIQESHEEKVKELEVQHKDAMRQLSVAKASLTQQKKEQMEEQTKFNSVEKQYKETLAKKESERLKLERRLVDTTSTLEHQTEINTCERRKNCILENKIEESEKRVLQLVNQLSGLQEIVDQQMKELENEKKKVTEVAKQRDQALTSNELDRQKFHKHLTDLRNRFETQAQALREEKEASQKLRAQLRAQKEIECQIDEVLEKEERERELIQVQLQEQKSIARQKESVLKKEKQAKELLQVQLQEQKNIVCQNEIALKKEMQAMKLLQEQLQEQKNIVRQIESVLEKEKQARELLQGQLHKQKNGLYKKNSVLEKDEDPATMLTDKQEKVLPTCNQVNWSLEKVTDRATVKAKEAAEKECTKANPLRLNALKMQELRGKMKTTLQRLGDKVNLAETEDDVSEQQKQQYILTKIKEEPVEAKYEEMQTEVDKEDYPPTTKRRRIETSPSTGSNRSKCVQLEAAEGISLIEITPETNIKQEPIEDEIVRTPIIQRSNDGSKEPKQERTEERQKQIKEEPRTETVVNNRKPLKIILRASH